VQTVKHIQISDCVCESPTSAQQQLRWATV